MIRFPQVLALASILALFPRPSAQAANASWTGATDGTWATGTNWSATPVPGVGNTATFNNAGNGNTTINPGSITISQINFDTATVAAYTLGATVSAGTITLGTNNNGIAMTSTVANNQLINSNIVLGVDRSAATYTLSNASTTNSLTIAGAIQGAPAGGTAGGKLLAVSGDGATTISSAITVGGATSLGLTKAGAGTLTLSGTGTNLSTIAVSEGKLTLGSASGVTSGFTRMGNTAGVATTLEILGGTHSLGEVYLSNVVGGLGMANQTGGDVSIARLGNQSTAGAGSVGVYNISAGTMSISTAYRGTFTAGDDFTLNISGTGAVTVGSGAVNTITRNGNGTLTISGNGTYNAGTSGLSIVESAGTTGTGTLNLNGGTLIAKSMDINTTAGNMNYINFNGGTFQATVGLDQNILSNNATLVATVKAGGAIFDTNGFDNRLFGNLIHDATLGATVDGGLTKKGAGTLTINGSSTYTGATKIQGGTVKVGVASVADTNGALGLNSAVTIDNVAGVSLDLNNKATQIGSLAGGGAVGGNVINGGATLTTGGNNTSTTYAGIISGTGGLVKNGTGAQTFTGANSFTGATTVNAGSLIIGVSGVGSTASVTTVTAGTLGGSGSSSKNVVIGNSVGTADSFLAPGNGGVGTFTTTGTLTLNSDARFVFELNSTTGTADQVAAAGVTITGSLATFSFSDIGTGGGVVIGNTYTIINNTAGSAIGGVFSNLANNSQFTTSGITYQASYTGGTGNDLVLTVINVVPEPSTWALLGLGLGVICFSTLRRKHQRLRL